MPTPGSKRLLSIREAAARAGIGRDWAYDLARTGILPGVVQRGRLYYVVTSVLDEALARGWPATPPAEAPALHPVSLPQPRTIPSPVRR